MLPAGSGCQGSPAWVLFRRKVVRGSPCPVHLCRDCICEALYVVHRGHLMELALCQGHAAYAMSQLNAVVSMPSGPTTFRHVETLMSKHYDHYEHSLFKKKPGAD